jgi:hypothetical protein
MLILYNLLVANKLSSDETVKINKIGCGRYPEEQHILIDNVVWQALELPNGFVKLLNAYLDTRHNKSVVRINVNGIELKNESDTIFCQFWFDGSTHPYVVKPSAIDLMWEWGYGDNDKVPYLITCPLNFVDTFPRSVSLTANPCDNAENNLMIIDEKPIDDVKKKFGVCGKQIDFEDRDFGIKFIEWLHMMRILGADKIYFHNRYVHQDFYGVLQYLEEQNYITMWPYLEPSGVDIQNRNSFQSYFLEMNTLNDCFYRLRNSYEYIVILDTDEVIMPAVVTDRNWADMLNNNFNLTIKRDGFTAQNLYYPNIGAEPFAGIPKYHYMLQHVQRSVNFSVWDEASKTIFVPDEILVVHNHRPLMCIDGAPCENEEMPTNISHSNHYRDHVDEPMFEETTEDKMIWRFKDELIKAVHKTLLATGFVP